MNGWYRALENTGEPPYEGFGNLNWEARTHGRVWYGKDGGGCFIHYSSLPGTESVWVCRQIVRARPSLGGRLMGRICYLVASEASVPPSEGWKPAWNRASIKATT